MILKNTILVACPYSCQCCTLKKLLCGHHSGPTVKLHGFLCPDLTSKLASVFLLGQWDSFRVPPDCPVLLLVTVWRCVFDCGSSERISRDNALVPVRGSHSGPCLLSHFPDKPNCISQECPGPQPVSCVTPYVVWVLLGFDPRVILPCCCQLISLNNR